MENLLIKNLNLRANRGFLSLPVTCHMEVQDKTGIM